ncbi:MAG TPA: type II secretion system F family protein [Streptosporangiaceae bacterium]
MSAVTPDSAGTILVGATIGAAVFLLITSLRGFEPRRPRPGQGRLDKRLRALTGVRGAVAVVAGLLVLIATGWLVAGIGIGLLAFSWNGLTGAASERRALIRLEGLATWTESLRDTIAGAVGLEQAIPASMRVASPALIEPLGALVDRMHTRVPLPDALRRFADDLNDPGADLIIAALIINSRLRGPGLRDLLGALAASVREELDVRRKVNADRRSTRRSVQIVVLISVGLAIVLALFDHSFLQPYDTLAGQLVMAIVAAVYAGGVLWLRRLARFSEAERLLASVSDTAPADAAGPAGSALASQGAAR